MGAGFSLRVARRGASGSVRNRSARSVVALERLRRRSDFRAAAGGTWASANAFVLQARQRGDEGAVRVGFTVSRQVGNAVERNRVRRRLREIVRLSAAAKGATGPDRLRPGHDYVLIGRRAALVLPFGEMMQELDAALGRIHAAAAGRTGGAQPGALHEAGSPAKVRKLRRSGRRPPESREQQRRSPRREP
ncbi:MAG TPA: ribonuclease P protein component [Xanthobacteraceae bacterium]|nr:ribonuclease P protein component [Xanthobacteraceae bacterium]